MVDSTANWDWFSPPSVVTRTPNPYLDIASTKIPKNIKEMFPLAEHYMLTQSLIQAALKKKSEYPVTSLVYDTEQDEKFTERWKTILEEKLELPEYLIDVNYNYYTYGNCFISVRYPIKKEIICSICGTRTPLLAYRNRLQIVDGRLTIDKCNNCNAYQPRTEIEDTPIRDPKRIRLVMWDPNKVGIRYNELTGDVQYEYNLPSLEREEIRTLKTPIEILAKMDQIYIDAALSPDSRVVIFSEDSIFHMKAPSLAGVDKAWGYPQVMSLVKDLYYWQTLKKANEAVMIGHMVPFRYVFPMSPPDATVPLAGINLLSWRRFVQQELARWKKDPNYIAIFPFQVGQNTFGGQGRGLLTQAEMNEMGKYILAGLGVPQEFVFGGLQWSGTNLSLRMLENEFLRLRKQNLKLLDFIISKVATLLDLPAIKVHFAEFKMADDAQRKQFFITMEQEGKLSLDTLHDEFGLDWKNEMVKRLAEIKDVQTVKKAEAIANAENQVAAQDVINKAQQQAVMQQQQMMGGNGMPPIGGPGGAPGGQVQGEQQSANTQQDAATMQNEQTASTVKKLVPEPLSDQKAPRGKGRQV